MSLDIIRDRTHRRTEIRHTAPRCYHGAIGTGHGYRNWDLPEHVVLGQGLPSSMEHGVVVRVSPTNTSKRTHR